MQSVKVVGILNYEDRQDPTVIGKAGCHGWRALPEVQ